MKEPKRIELPTIFGMKTVNCFLFKEPEPVLIDCGEKSPLAKKALEKALGEEGLTIRDIAKVIITHAHSDHMGMAAKIAEDSNAEIWISELGYPWAVDLEKMLDRRTQAIQSVFLDNLGKAKALGNELFSYKNLLPYWEVVPADRLHVFAPDGKIQFGGQEWECIHTPGHCFNQSCFYHPEHKWLISADMLLKRISTPIVDASLEAPFQRVKSMLMLLESYDKLASLPIRKVFPGHYENFDNAAETIRNQLHSINKKKEKCFRLIQKGKHDFMELAHAIYPNRVNPATFFMVIGFLDLLEEEGRIEAEQREGKLAYFEKSSEAK